MNIGSIDISTTTDTLDELFNGTDKYLQSTEQFSSEVVAKHGKEWKGLVGTRRFSPAIEEIQAALSKSKKFLYQAEMSIISIVTSQVTPVIEWPTMPCALRQNSPNLCKSV